MDPWSDGPPTAIGRSTQLDRIRRLVPPGRRGAHYRWLFFAAGPLEAAVANRAIGFDLPADKEAMAGYSNFGLVMDTLETAVGGRNYVVGETFSASDVYIGSHIGRGVEIGLIERRPAFDACCARLTGREAYRRATALDGKAAAAAG